LKINITRLCISYHHIKNCSINEIINNHSFKLFFKCNKQIVLKLQEIVDIYKINQIEICFYKAFSVFGWHRDRKSKYKIIGGCDFNNLQFPKKEFIQLLLNHSLTLSKNTNMHIYPIKFNKKNQKLTDIKQIMQWFITQYGGEIKNKTENNTVTLTSSCPNYKLHSKKIYRNTDFNIIFYKNNSEVYAGCWHNSCTLKNTEILEKIFQDYFKNKNQNKPFLYDTNNFKTIKTDLNIQSISSKKKEILFKSTNKNVKKLIHPKVNSISINNKNKQTSRITSKSNDKKEKNRCNITTHNTTYKKKLNEKSKKILEEKIKWYTAILKQNPRDKKKEFSLRKSIKNFNSNYKLNKRIKAKLFALGFKFKE